MRLQLAARGENVLFGPKNLHIWGEKSIFGMVIAIFVNRAYHKYTQGYNFPFWTTRPSNRLFFGGTVPAVKKMTQHDTGPGLSRNYGETAVFTFKKGFNPKKTAKIS